MRALVRMAGLQDVAQMIRFRLCRAWRVVTASQSDKGITVRWRRESTSSSRCEAMIRLKHRVGIVTKWLWRRTRRRRRLAVVNGLETINETKSNVTTEVTKTGSPMRDVGSLLYFWSVVSVVVFVVGLSSNGNTVCRCRLNHIIFSSHIHTSHYKEFVGCNSKTHYCIFFVMRIQIGFLWRELSCQSDRCVRKPIESKNAKGAFELNATPPPYGEGESVEKEKDHRSKGLEKWTLRPDRVVYCGVCEEGEGMAGGGAEERRAGGEGSGCIAGGTDTRGNGTWRGKVVSSCSTKAGLSLSTLTVICFPLTSRDNVFPSSALEITLWGPE